MANKEIVIKEELIFKRKIQKSYDIQSSLYEKILHSDSPEKPAMQLGNLRKLLDYMQKVVPIDVRGKYLDLGCGNGIMIKVLSEKLGGIPTEYFGIDFSLSLVRSGMRLFPNSNFIVGDIDFLPFTDNFFDYVISNSVLHWLNFPEIGKSPQKAIIDAFRVVKEGGIFAMSVSGYGTAKKFQEVYREVAKIFACELGSEFRKKIFRADPIGSIHLKDLENLLLDAGFSILSSTLDYEPVIYQSASDYVDAVKAYGYEIYLAPFPHDIKEQVWNEIKLKFIKKIGESAYKHDQYMIYIISRKTLTKHCINKEII